MQPLSVQAVLPEMQFRESKTLIPHSQGLLATTDTSDSAPVLPPSNDSIQNDPASQVLGLKLLQLHRPPLPHQIASHYPPAQMLHTAHPAMTNSHQHKFRNINQSASKRTEEEKRNGSTVPKKQLGFNSPHDPTQPKIQTSERSRGQEFSRLPLAHTPAPMQGLRLLQFQPVPQSNITFPKLPLPSSSRPTTVIRAPMGEATIKLLHIESGPKMASNTSTTSRIGSYILNLLCLCIVVEVQISVSATDVAPGSPFSPNDPSHLYGGVDKFSDRQAEC